MPLIAADSVRWEHAAWPWVIGGIVAGALVVAAWAGKTEIGDRSKRWAILYGEDDRRSTSKLAAFAWTVALLGGGTVLLAAALLNDAVKSLGLDEIPEEYLVLLGVPYGTAVLAKGIVEAKIAGGNLQKPPGVEGGFTAGDDGRVDLIDTQYLAFNALLLLYFIAPSWRTGPCLSFRLRSWA